MLRLDYQMHEAGLLPLCDVILIGRTRRAKVRAVIDSGATHPIFPMLSASDAGIDITAGRSFPVVFGGSIAAGGLVETYVEISRVRFRLDIVFVESIKLGYALLGRRTFFNQFNEVAFLERGRMPRCEL